MLNIAELSGINADGVTDDYATIMTALDNAAASISSGRSVAVNWGDKTYKLSQGLPIVANMAWFAPCRRGTVLKVSGSLPGIYSATYASGVFSDNFDATVTQVADKTRSCHNSEISGITVDHIGAISGNMPSGVACKASIQLVGFFDGLLDNVRAENNCQGKDGFFARMSWRIKGKNLLSGRGNVVTGGRGIHIGDQCHNFYLENPGGLGGFEYAVAIDAGSDKINGGTIVNINAETADCGLLVAGSGINVVGGYIENCKTDLALGVISGAKAYKPHIVGVFHGTSAASEYFCRLNNVSQFWLDPVFQDNASYSIGRFKFEAQADANYCFYRNERFLIGDVDLLPGTTNAAVHVYSPYSALALNRKGANNAGDMMNFFLDGVEEAYIPVSTTGASILNK